MTDANSSDSDKRARALGLDRLEEFLKSQMRRSRDPNPTSPRKDRLKTTGLVVAISTILLLPIALLSIGEIYEYSVSPPEIESSFAIKRQSGSAVTLFNRVLMFSDEAEYEVSSLGYSSDSQTFSHQSEQRAYSFELTPLPGYLNVVVTNEFHVSIRVNGNLSTQLEAIELAQGRHVVAVEQGGAKLASVAVDIDGYGNTQEISFDLSDYQAMLSVATKPQSATIELDGRMLGHGVFKGGVPALASQLRIHSTGYDAQIRDVSLASGDTLDLGVVELSPSPINATISTIPSNASVLLDGSFVGESTTTLTLRPGRSYELIVRKPGYREHTAVLTPKIGKNISRTINFEQETIRIDVQASPAATLLVNGIAKGAAPLTLDVYPGDVIEARSEGLTTQSKTVREEHGAHQSIGFELLEPSEHAYQFASERLTVTGGLELIRFPPVRFRKSIDIDNQESMTIEITRPFYLGATEVTFDAYQKYDPSVKGPNKHPVTDISWTDAAKFCNWLSAQHGLQPFYHISPYDVVEGVDVTSLGFRLPTENEWETGAGFDWREELVFEPFEWGKSRTIPLAFANLAGRETAKVGSRHFRSFTDNHESVAPVASYLPNANGLYDITGNVSEWIHNYFQTQREANAGPDYLGPRTGFTNVVKGSNYKTYTIDEVAMNFRDFETGKRLTLGFRVARWLH